LIAKRLELLHQMVPGATSIAVLVNPDNPIITDATVTEAQAAARALDLNLSIVNGRSGEEIAGAFSNLAAQRAGALLVAADSYFFTQIEQFVELAKRYATPTSYEDRLFTAAGGLMSYGPDQLESSHQLGVLAGRILDGRKPADLPVQQSVKFPLVVNLKAAKALGLEAPTSILLRADEVIE
jgi:putative ABC transport system substrate-binding protein